MVTPITAALVKELRDQTGAGMMDCKKALMAAQGDLVVAAEAMRKSGQIEAEKKSSRVAAEGVIVIKSNAQRCVVLEINCETDFVARDENFKQFAEAVAQLAIDQHITSIEALLPATFSSDADHSVETMRQNLTAKLGENIQLRRLAYVESESAADNCTEFYVHTGRVGAIVQLRGGDAALAKDLALHVIANNPLAISIEDISDELITKEQAVFVAQARSSGKPQAVIDQMIADRVEKFFNEMTLLGQNFIKDDSISVKTLLDRSGAEVVSFVRFEVGEGVEKPKQDFAQAVMAQIKDS